MESSRLFEQLNIVIRKLPHQKLSNYVTLLLLVYLAYTLSGFVWQLIPITSDKGKVLPIITSVAKSNSSTAGVDTSKLLALNVFGKVEKVKAVQPKVKMDQPAPKTRLNVTLTGLVADSADAVSPTSVAIIESKSAQNTYGIADKVDGTNAVVHQILIDRVILQVSGRFETLMLDGIEYSTTPPSNATEQSQQNTRVDHSDEEPEKRAVVKEKLDKRDNIELSESLRAQREQLFDDPKKLLDVIRIRPYRVDQELKGYRLSPGKDPKLFEEVGLKRNDLATSINGYDLTDMQQALSVMAELKEMTEATITVVRKDTTIDIILAL